MYYVTSDDATLPTEYSTRMAQDPASRNGAKPDSDEADNLTPFERFERLTRHVLSVPKAEIDKRRDQSKRSRTRTPTAR